MQKLCFVFFSLLRLLIAHCITKPLIPSILLKSRQVDNNQSVTMSFSQMMNLNFFSLISTCKSSLNIGSMVVFLEDVLLTKKSSIFEQSDSGLLSIYDDHRTLSQN